jgi:hypothetical protein
MGCNPGIPVHRKCFDEWPEREAVTRAEFERFGAATDTQGKVAVFYRNASIVAALAIRTETLDHALILLRHVRALDLVVIALEAWPDWLARREPTWRCSAHVDDLGLVATELPALQAAWPSPERIVAAEPVKMVLARVALDWARKRDEELAIRRDNEHARAIAGRLRERPPGCPHCAAVLRDVRFVEGGDLSRSYFICQACGRSFLPAVLRGGYL